MATDAFAGPVDFVVFAFDEHASVSVGLHAVLDRVDAGIVEILDIEVIGRDADGAPVILTLADLPASAEIDLAVFDGVASDILDTDDHAQIAQALQPGQFALALVYEDRSLATAAAAWAEAGAVELFSGGVDIADLDRTLEDGENS